MYLSGGRGLPSGPGGRLDGISKNRETEVLLPKIVELRSESITVPEMVLPIGTHSVPRLKVGEALPLNPNTVGYLVGTYPGRTIVTQYPRIVTCRS